MSIVSYLAAVLADIPPLNIVLLFTPTWIIVLIALVELFGLSRVQPKDASPDAVILRRSPWPIIIPTVILFICNAVPLLGPSNSDGTPYPLLLGFFAFIFACAGLVKFPVVFIADQTGLTRCIPFFSKTLPWSTIDWLYIRQAAMIYRSPLGLGRANDQQLIVEAGPRKNVKIPLRASRAHVKPGTLRKIIQERATNALIGYDKQQQVQQRRASTVHTMTR